MSLPARHLNLLITQNNNMSTTEKNLSQINHRITGAAQNSFLNRGEPVEVEFMEGEIEFLRGVASDLGITLQEMICEATSEFVHAFPAAAPLRPYGIDF